MCSVHWYLKGNMSHPVSPVTHSHLSGCMLHTAATAGPRLPCRSPWRVCNPSHHPLYICDELFAPRHSSSGMFWGNPSFQKCEKLRRNAWHRQAEEATIHLLTWRMRKAQTLQFYTCRNKARNKEMTINPLVIIIQVTGPTNTKNQAKRCQLHQVDTKLIGSPAFIALNPRSLPPGKASWTKWSKTSALSISFLRIPR